MQVLREIRPDMAVTIEEKGHKELLNNWISLWLGADNTFRCFINREKFSATDRRSRRQRTDDLRHRRP